MYGNFVRQNNRVKVRRKRTTGYSRSSTNVLRPLSLKHATAKNDIQDLHLVKNRRQKKIKRPSPIRKKRNDRQKASVLLLIETNVLFGARQQEQLMKELTCGFPLPCIYKKRSLLSSPNRGSKTGHVRSTSNFLIADKDRRRVKVRIRYSKDIPGPFFGGTNAPAACCELVVKDNIIGTINREVQKKIQNFVAHSLRRHLAVPIDRYFLRVLGEKQVGDHTVQRNPKADANLKFRQLNAELAVRNGLGSQETGDYQPYGRYNSTTMSPPVGGGRMVPSPFHEMKVEHDNFVLSSRAMSPSLPYRAGLRSPGKYSAQPLGIDEGIPCTYGPLPSTPSRFYDEHDSNTFGYMPKTPDTPYGGIGYMPKTPGTPYGGIGYMPKTPVTPYGGLGYMPKTPGTPYGGIGHMTKTPDTPYGGLGYMPKTPGTPYGGLESKQGVNGAAEFNLLQQGDNLIKRRMIHSRARSSGMF